MSTFRMFHGLVEDGCPELEDESVDLTIMSPPYFGKDGWTKELMRALGRLLARVSRPGARIYMAFGQIAEGMTRPQDSARLILAGARGALDQGQTIIWVKSYADEGPTKGHFTPIDNSPNILNYSFEYLFQFTKGPWRDAPALDKFSPPVGVPYKDKSNLTRGTRGKRGDVHCGGDVWIIRYETTGATKKKEHRHAFPLLLAEKCLVVSGVAGLSGGVVFDPFTGGGTVMQAAHAKGLNVAGLDRDPAVCEKVRAKWELLNRPFIA